MVFSSVLFLFLFLPVALTGYLFLPGVRARNAWLLVVSLAFYGWGEPWFLVLLVLSTLFNHRLGLWLDRAQEPARRGRLVKLGVGINLGLLIVFKYAGFLFANLDQVLLAGGLPAIGPVNMPLPIGISFFTFHALSYLIDIYRRQRPAGQRMADVALYMFFFPQLIAGPILRWKAIAPQLAARTHTLENFAEGIRRFACGLGKKVLIANTLAGPVDQVFALPPGELSTPLAWLGAVGYALQLYFDFSGYTDMAIGLAKMFGFEFAENFRWPFVARSITEFWQRWHITLSTWFRDYLFFPLSRTGMSAARKSFNILFVFFLCGLWHGASWTFAVWGLYHGVFLVLEQTPVGRLLLRLPRPFGHAYVLLVVLISFVIFRSETLSGSLGFLAHMFGLESPVAAQPFARFVGNQFWCALGVALLFATPVWSSIRSWTGQRTVWVLFENLLALILLVVSAVWLAGGTYNPFIYFRF